MKFGDFRRNSGQVSIDYRLYGLKPTAKNPGGAETSNTDAMYDAKAAVRWLRKNAAARSKEAYPNNDGSWTKLEKVASLDSVSRFPVANCFK